MASTMLISGDSSWYKVKKMSQRVATMVHRKNIWISFGQMIKRENLWIFVFFFGYVIEGKIYDFIIL